MEFKFHEDKNDTNLKKHGIDFRKAQEIWQDPFAVEVPS